jgi:hypothetical protein
MYNLYSKYIHYNEYTQKWYVFERSEATHYLNDSAKLKTLKEYKSIEDLLKDHKKETND